jgi:hypothetical protein
MIFKVQTLAMPLLRGLLLTIVLNLVNVSDAVANLPFSIDNVASLAKKLAAEPFKPPQPIPDFLRQLSYDDYRDIRFDPEQSLWKETGSHFQVQFIHPGLYYAHSVAINIYDAHQKRERNRNSQEKMLKDGPTSLSPSERAYLLRDAESMAALHHGVWQTNNTKFAIQQGLAKARQTSNHGGKAMRTPILRHNDLSLQDARSRGRLC